MWDEWRRLTKFLGSARIAFAQALDRTQATDGVIEMPLGDGPSIYRTSIAEHRKALNDLHTLHSLVLVRSFSLAESHCRLAHRVAERKEWHLLDGTVPDAVLAAAENEKLVGGIESWGARLLKLVGQNWPSDFGNKAGLVEASIVRNLMAHGRSKLDEIDMAAALARGAALPFAVGQPIRIEYPLLNVYRGHLRQFCRTVSDGVVHMARGTHHNLVPGAISEKAVGSARKARSRP